MKSNRNSKIIRNYGFYKILEEILTRLPSMDVTLYKSRRNVGCCLAKWCIPRITATKMVRTKADVKKYDVSSSSSKNDLTVEGSLIL